jgi:hypothetical protein
MEPPQIKSMISVRKSPRFLGLTYPLKTNIEIVDFPRFAMVPDGAGILSG